MKLNIQIKMMRNFGKVIACLIITTLLQSCLNDDSNLDVNTNLALVTIRLKDVADKHDFFFVLDNNETINPINKSSIGYTAVDGQRAFAYIKLLDNEAAEYDAKYNYNAEVLYIEDILTKDIIPLTSQTNDSIGNDPINITNAWIAQDYITIECQFFRSYNSDIKHMLNLVYDMESPLVDDDGYVCLQFRHNAFNDSHLIINETLVSFKMENIADLMEQSKGVKISMNSIYEGVQNVIIEHDVDDINSRNELKSIGNIY